MIPKYLAILFASFALAGCCLSGNGCYAPLTETPVAWDGLGSAPTENGDEYKPKRNSSRKHEIIVGPLNDTAAQSDHLKSQSNDRWATEQAANREADAKLTKQLMICRNC
jgi:hypothetical protein